MQEGVQNRYKLLRPNDLIMLKYGSGYLLYKIENVTETVGRPPYSYNSGVGTLLLQRNGQPAKPWRGRPRQKRISSWQVQDGLGSKAMLLEDYIEACRKGHEFYIQVFNQYYSR